MRKARQYAYVVTQVSARKGALIPRGLLLALCEASSLDEVVSRLRESRYGRWLSEVPAPPSAEKLERAFMRSYVEDLQDALEHLPERARGFLSSSARRFLYDDVKVVLKCKISGASAEDTLSKLYEAGELDPRAWYLIKRSAEAESLEKAMSILRSARDLGEAAGMAYEAYKKYEVAALIDAAVDKYFYTELWKAFDKMDKTDRGRAIRFLGFETDVYNLVTAARGKLWGVPLEGLREVVIARYYLLSPEEVNGLLMETRTERLAEHVLKTRYGKFLEAEGTIEERIRGFERRLGREAMSMANKAFMEQRLHIGAVVAYMKLKELEVRNLIAISQGVERGVQPRLIQESLAL